MDHTNESCIRPLIYADIDLNLIDGSAVWVTSVVETLSQDENVHPTLLLKRPIIRDVLTASLQRKPNVTVIDPWSKQFKMLNLDLDDDSWFHTKTLSVSHAADIMEQLDQLYQYDMFLVRGYVLSKEIAHNRSFANRTWFYITDFPQRLNELTHTHLEDLTAIYNNGDKLLCQTPTLIDYYKKLLNTVHDHKFIYLPPMVPNACPDIEEFKNRHNRLIYAGKFTPLWNVPEMFQAFNRIEDSSLEFVVAGEKFHNYPYRENYDAVVKGILQSSPQIVWKKGLSREDVQRLIQSSDVGVSWRHKVMDQSKELSTKVLEYGLYGKPVIMNRNELHEAVFGKDYPLFANNEKQFIDKVRLAFSNPHVYEKAARCVYEVSQRHTFKNVYEQLKPHIHNKSGKRAGLSFAMSVQVKRPIHVLFAGHDLKFARPLMDYFKLKPFFRVKEDQWKGHNRHDESASLERLKWADVIIAEWGLGNAVWYSRHKHKRQKLVVRMHRQERETDYPKQVNWEQVDHLVLISPMLIKEFEECFKIPYEKTSIYYNLLDVNDIQREKLDGYRFNLGIVGVVPKMKRLDLALDIFEALWCEDSRYTLYVKGKFPNEYPWLWKREEEKDYYRQVFRRINRSPWRDSVVFDGWGRDIPEWFRKIGFILSPSDFESFHMAIAEGMASGAIPVIRNRVGVTDLYPKEFIYHSVEDATSLIRRANAQHSLSLREKAKDYVRQFDKYTVGRQWEELVVSLYLGQKVEANISQFS